MISPSSLTFEQIQSISLKNDRKVPAVKEVFAYFKDKKNLQGGPIKYSLDLKTLKMGIPLIQLAEEIGIAEHVELTPNDNYPTFWKYVSQYRSISSNIQIVDSAHFEMEWLKKLFRKMYYQNWEKFHKFGLKAVNLKADRATDEVIEMVRAKKLKMYVWDCHSEDIIRKFCQKGVDAIYTDYPDLAYKIRN